ncbi:MAG: DUF2752 domain-containing protein [Acidobacteriaceae bacterium]|nr:DUF2752 domain-containing protein [Acidobacteriaceae bacterium]
MPMSSAARHNRIAEIRRAVVPLAFVAAIAAALWRFPPERYSFYPRCLVYSLFHLQCPGCGATRALAALLQGHLYEALRFNALVTLLSPVIFGWAAVCYARFVRHQPMRWPEPPRAALYAVLGLAVLFTVARNLL